MRINEDTQISYQGKDVVLVPYKDAHVVVYHEWMTRPDLLKLTCSEPLTLAEEYENMESWRTDEGKLTFIILDRGREHAMAGDVNLYLLPDNDEETASEKAAEIEVMIAETKSRRRGLALHALKMLMAYAEIQIGVQTFVAKILEENAASISLFSKLGFKEFRRIAAFKEIHFVFKLDAEGKQKLQRVRQGWIIQSYVESPLSRIEHTTIKKS